MSSNKKTKKPTGKNAPVKKQKPAAKVEENAPFVSPMTMPVNTAHMDIANRRMMKWVLSICAILLVVMGVSAWFAYKSGRNLMDEICGSAKTARMPKETITLLHPEWEQYLALTQEIRRLSFLDKNYRRTLNSRAWKSPNPANQYIGREYQQWFTAMTPPRVLNIPGIANARDFGGWKAGDGWRIKQGLIIRCGEFNAASVYGGVGRSFLTIESKRILLKDLRIKTDIDLRSRSETAGLTESPIDPSVNWVFAPFGLYQWIYDDACKAEFKHIFQTLSNPDNLPAAVHCIYGKDRTGTLCYLLQGILGVSDDDKLRDWEVSGFWFYDMRFIHMYGVDGLISYLWSKCPGKTLNERCVYYAKSCGITEEEIEAFRRLMLERDYNQ